VAKIARDALAAGNLTTRDLRSSIAATAKDRDVQLYSMLDAEDQLDVYRLANEGERVKFRPVAVKKLLSAARTLPREQWAKLKERFADVIAELLRPKKKAA
jgi:hypothetical protein